MKVDLWLYAMIGLANASALSPRKPEEQGSLDQSGYPDDYPKDDYPEDDYPKDDYPEDDYKPDYPKDDYKPDYPKDDYKPDYPKDDYKPDYPKDDYKPDYPKDDYKPDYPKDDYKPDYPKDDYKPDPPKYEDHKDDYKPDYPKDDYKPDYPKDDYEPHYPKDDYKPDYPKDDYKDDYHKDGYHKDDYKSDYHKDEYPEKEYPKDYPKDGYTQDEYGSDYPKDKAPKAWKPKTHHPEFFSLKVDDKCPAAPVAPAAPLTDEEAAAVAEACQFEGFAIRLEKGVVIATPYNKWWDAKLPIFFVDDDTQTYTVSKKPLQMYVDSSTGALRYAPVGWLPPNAISISFYKLGNNPLGKVGPSPSYFAWPTTEGRANTPDTGKTWWLCPISYTGQWQVFISDVNFGDSGQGGVYKDRCQKRSLAAINANPWKKSGGY